MNTWFTTLSFLHLIDWRYHECYHAARFEKESRYYVIRLTKDLLDDWVIILTNGRIKSKLGQNRTLAFNNFNEGLNYFCALAKIRHQRGYHLKYIDCDNDLTLFLLPYLIDAQDNLELLDVKNFEKIKKIERKKTNKVPALNHTQASDKQLGFSF
ncbi:TPA: WGR domain-containing protein [Legionella pneumophila]|uniref:WGR domain-containing protein n=1 Tax=Legionella pneumophila TaxID=446 RepID=UPI001A32CEDC|nr:WGR domain-containing protein [Legionella pneumophila]MDI9826319.1 WGR domain-containing protein [Legionella pneumophila]HAU0908753.1 WGR domain-containing protein [Legionella pneumophila]HAU1359124.1 WGR domain-containing protein [Legionella pneumophila]HAU1458289.1 WGR domain-containing protein [Legionella pneumophila]HBD7231037.1 WGR domain-containing protein [Legionella pneumophila]